MKNNLKNSLRVSALTAVAALALVSCNDWTEPESLGIETPSVDAGLYADYLKNLKSYKAGPHKAVFVTFENNKEYPAIRAEHLTVLPDSIDFISLNNPAELHPVLAKEMTEVRKKGTRVVYNIDFSTFESEWIQLLKEDEDGLLTEDDALAYFTQRTNELLALCDEWGYDGLTFTYMGRALVSLPEADIPAYDARQRAFLEPIAKWRASHKSSSFVFIGNPQFLLEANRTLLAECDYIAVSTDAATNADDLTVRSLAAVAGSDIPANRILVTAQTTRPDDEKHIYGYFGSTDANGNPVRSVYGCAQWVMLPSAAFTRSGLMIRNAQYAYFDNTLVYRYIREAIGIMNPSPKN